MRVYNDADTLSGCVGVAVFGSRDVLLREFVLMKYLNTEKDVFKFGIVKINR